jgi:hypothetical protein
MELRLSDAATKDVTNVPSKEEFVVLMAQRWRRSDAASRNVPIKL